MMTVIDTAAHAGQGMKAMTTDTMTPVDASVMAWSQPYCDTMHLDEATKQGFQFTVVDHSSHGFAECHIFTPGCGFSAIESMHASVDEAKAYAEKQARSMNALASAAHRAARGGES